MSYLEQIKAIIDSVSHQFDVLGIFVFTGEGDEQSVVKSFVDVYETYQKVKELTTQTFGDAPLSVAADSMWCNPAGGEVESEDNHFDTDNRFFSKSYAKYGVYPTDKTLPYKASKSSANGKYVHPENDKTSEDDETKNNNKRARHKTNN